MAYLLTPNTQEKRLERQREEAKVHRREAARRRTRDILLERAKQRLLAASSSRALMSGDGLDVNGRADDGSGVSSGKRDIGLGERGRFDEVPLYAQETWVARRSKV